MDGGDFFFYGQPCLDGSLVDVQARLLRLLQRNLQLSVSADNSVLIGLLRVPV